MLFVLPFTRGRRLSPHVLALFHPILPAPGFPCSCDCSTCPAFGWDTVNFHHSTWFLDSWPNFGSIGVFGLLVNSTWEHRGLLCFWAQQGGNWGCRRNWEGAEAGQLIPVIQRDIPCPGPSCSAIKPGEKEEMCWETFGAVLFFFPIKLCMTGLCFPGNGIQGYKHLACRELTPCPAFCALSCCFTSDIIFISTFFSLHCCPDPSLQGGNAPAKPQFHRVDPTGTREAAARFGANLSYKMGLCCGFSSRTRVVSVWGSPSKQEHREQGQKQALPLHAAFWEWLLSQHDFESEVCVSKISKGGSELQQLEICFDCTLINFLGRGWDALILQKCGTVFFVLLWSFPSCILAKTFKSESTVDFQFQFILGSNSNPKNGIFVAILWPFQWSLFYWPRVSDKGEPPGKSSSKINFGWKNGKERGKAIKQLWENWFSLGE